MRRVLISDLSYPNYESLIRIQGASPVYYPTKSVHKFLPDISEIERRITPFKKAIIINSPGNPTGVVYTKEKWLEIIHLAEKYDLYIISDEIYDELVYESEHIPPLTLSLQSHDRMISIFGFSKVYAMTGWRLAYMVVPKHLFSLMCKLQEPINTCPSSISQKTGEAALDGPQDFVSECLKIYRKQRDISCELLSKYEMNFITPKGSIYIPIKISETNMLAKAFESNF